MPNRLPRLSAVVLASLLVACTPDGSAPAPADVAREAPVPLADAPRRASGAPDASSALEDAIRAHARNVPVEGVGTVARVLRDDREGNPHQKFLLRVAGGTTVLVAHNIDVAPRLDGLAEGDEVAFRGDYIWSPKGGTVHWTHRDPHGGHRDGWLRWNGRTYD